MHFSFLDLGNWSQDKAGFELLAGPYTDSEVAAVLQKIAAEHCKSNDLNNIRLTKQAVKGTATSINGTSQIYKCAFFYECECPWKVKKRTINGSSYICYGCEEHDHTDKGKQTKAISTRLLGKLTPSKGHLRPAEVAALIYPIGAAPSKMLSLKRKLARMSAKKQLSGVTASQARTYGGLHTLIETRK